MVKIVGIIAAIIIIFIGWVVIKNGTIKNIPTLTQIQLLKPQPPVDPLSLQFMRSQSYPGSDIKIEEKLSPGSNYNRYIVSFNSDGLNEFALMTVPNGTKPSGGFPVIIFNHGYITPEKYTPDGNYIAYVDALSKAGYIVFKPDYRGNGKSEGIPTSEFYSQDYVIDDLNAIASVKKFDKVNPEKIGVWGHSMGGNVALKDLVISKDIKAVVIWSGVVGTIEDITYNFQTKVAYIPSAEDIYLRYKNLPLLISKYGNPRTDSSFWNSIDPINYLSDENIPVQIHVGLADNQVPPDFSKNLYTKLKSLNKTAEFYEYPGANHDINQSFDLAMERTIEFFNHYLK